MKRLSLALVCLSAVAASNAALNFTFTLGTAYKTVAKPVSGTTTVTWSGTIDILLPTYDATSMFVEFPGLTAGGPFLSFAGFDAGFLAYLGALAPGVDYSGDLFSFDVSSGNANGNYWFNGTGGGLSTMAEAFAFGTDGVHTVKDNELFGVTVVPEPASMAVLGMGVLAVLRRRKAR
jgi:hypothetical protein